MTNALITGISGFTGHYLHDHLVSQKIAVFGLDIHGSAQNHIFKGSITDRRILLHALEESKPDVIFHLAGILKSAETEKFYNIHVLGTTALLDAVVEIGLRPHVVVASSSAIYGIGVGKKVITETFTPRPATHYAASKRAQEIVSLRYFESYRLPITCARAFNLLGPGLSPNMAPSTFAKQIAQAELRHKSKTIYTGDLSACRDYMDIRDAVRAYALLAEHGKAGQIYNVCSGKATSIQECLQILLDQASVPIEVALDSALMQKQDVPVQIGSAKKIKQLTGWKPEIKIKQSLADLLNDWREKINAENIL
jgi:GDP-4-dehydro-6-deoxy-D-mannose reductase